MTDVVRLKEAIENSGVSITHIAGVLGCSRNRVYSILNGSECTVSEVTGITGALHLTKSQRDSIFFAQER